MIIAQISDPHVSQLGGKTDLTFETAAHLRRAVTHLIQLRPHPDVVLITGDCVDDGSAIAYVRFRELISPLTMPVYLVPGNHDDRVHMQALFGPQGARPMAGFVQYVVEDFPVRLIALDTHIPGSAMGHLCAEQLGWLEERLAEAPQRPTVLFMHHPPFVTYLPPLDAIGLASADALGAIIARYPNVERIVSGHVHRAIQRRFHGTLAMTCPSTAHQIFLDFRQSEQADQFVAIMEPPACLLHVWRETIGLVSHMSFIGDYGAAIELE